MIKFYDPSTKLFVMLLAADFVFIFLTLLYGLGIVTDQRFLITHDLSYGEFFQYTKESFIAFLFFLLALKKRRLLYFAWCLLFIYFLLDDSMSLHENWGLELVSELDLYPILNLRARDLGELIVSLFFGSILFTLIAVAYYFSPPEDKKISQILFLQIAILAFFGVFVDMVHSALALRGLGLIEDGGEMIVMSTIAWYVYKLK
jgi:hypothetical protein